jgi:spore coat protein CotF
MNMQQTNTSMNNMTTMMNTSDTRLGGHEVMDVHEILHCTIATLDQYMLYRQHAKDPELIDMIDRQHRFMLDNYNILVECFKTGTNPSHPTSSYKMNQTNDVVYGLKPTEPKKPKLNASEIGDQCISGYMLGLMKADARQLTTASLECTNPVVRRVIADSIPNYVEMAYELFQYQNKKGYYQVAVLAPQDMQTILNSYTTSTSGQQLQ